MGYKVVVENTDMVKVFDTYQEARRFMTETKKNWAAQIDEMQPCKERESLIEMYFSIKVAR